MVKKLIKFFLSDITIDEIVKAFYLILGLSNYHYFILSNDSEKKIGLNEKRKLKEFGNNILLEERYPDKIGSHIRILGKQNKFISYSNNKKLYSYVI